jgi:putative SOS response-associated peptidase YedK
VRTASLHPTDAVVLDEWLTAEPARAAALIGPAPEDALVATAVSKHVNSVRNDDPECVVPAEHGAEPAQGSLF